jgi:hypothetical protein
VIELIFELLFEILFEVLTEIALAQGWESLRHSLLRQRSSNPILAGIGFVIVGAVLGFITTLIFPERIFPEPPLKVISLIVSPIAVGFAMHFFGSWRRRRGHDTSYLATFWGGALFAFALTFVRFILVGGITDSGFRNK